MQLFIITLCLTLPLVIVGALIINFARRRVGRTRHGLTGMCHESGGAMCGCCAASMQKDIRKID